MATINGIDYGDLIFSKRLEIDQLAYSRYYSDNYPIYLQNNNTNEDDLIIFEDDEKDPLTFNEWHGTKSHRKYVLPLLRKMKLKKINEISEKQ